MSDEKKETARRGSRQQVPADALKFCPSCGTRRGNVKKGWDPITRDGEVVGYTCPACPEWSEPIRREEKGGRARYLAVVSVSRDGRRRQVKRRHDTLAAARAWVAEVRAAGEPPAVNTVEALSERWLTSRADIRQVTRDGYRNDLRAVLNFMGTRDVSEVTFADVEEMTGWMGRAGGARGQGLGTRAVRGALIALGQMFDLAIREGLVATNPVRIAKRPRKRKRVGKDLEHWTSDELLTFRETADGDDLAGAWRLTLAGLTRADVMGLRWSDVDLEAGSVSISQGRIAVYHGDAVDDPKSAQRVRAVPVEAIHPGTAALLKRMKARQAEERLRAGAAYVASGYVVVNALGLPLRPEVYSDRFRRLEKVAGVPDITLHAVRHSLAFWLHHVGVAPADAAALLGHSVEVHLATYLPHSGAAGIAAAASALGLAQSADEADDDEQEQASGSR